MPHRRFATPRHLLRAWAEHNRTLASLARLRAEAEAERDALAPEMVALLEHFPAGLTYEGVTYDAVFDTVLEVPAPFDAVELDGWPGDATDRGPHGYPALAAIDGEVA